jgi:hypothetical protein
MSGISEPSGTRAGRLARAIVRLYPRAWRAHYEAEALDLLALRTPTWGDLGNLAYHALYTRLHPDLLATLRGASGSVRAAQRAEPQAAPEWPIQAPYPPGPTGGGRELR